MHKKIIMASVVAAVLALGVVAVAMPYQAFATGGVDVSHNGNGNGNGGIGGAGGAGGVGGNGGSNSVGEVTAAGNHQSANGGSANGGNGGSANGGSCNGNLNCLHIK